VIERERKLSAPPGFALPSLDHLGTVVPLGGQRLEATYYDTPDLRLARAGISVRHRTGEGRARWTVKLPIDAATHRLSRREVDVVAPASPVPKAVVSLVLAHVRTAGLAPVGTLRTTRRRTEVRNATGAVLVEVAEDDVEVDGAAGFREVEIEQRPDGSAADVDAVAQALVAAGAGEVDQTPKIVRALGARALLPAEGAEIAVGPESSLATVVQAAVTAGLGRLLAHDPGVRLGGDDEDVHQARVAARRLRSDLRTFRSAVEAEVAQPLRAELRWLGGVLGEVRDADVLLEHLRGAVERLPTDDGPAADALLARLGAERDRATRRARRVLDSGRYVDLVEALALAADEPPVLADAAVPAAEALPGIVRRPWKHLQKAVESFGHDQPSDAQLHELRIRAKRLRYAADVAVPVIGKPARRLAKAAAALQGTLGELQDAVVAEAWLRQAAVTTDEAIAAGLLVAAQRDRRRRAREEWRDDWRRLSSRNLRSWLR
jgi:CHAD domain-containing protein